MIHPYARQDYAESLSHVGRPVLAPEWGGYLLGRTTALGGRPDATGPYPLTVLAEGAEVAAGLERLKIAGFVSVVLVVEDWLRPSMRILQAACDTVRPFKSHYVYDRSLGPIAYGKHHRYEIRRALARVDVAEIALADHLPAWEGLYGQLADRHGLAGVHAFRPAHHALLARLPGTRTFGAFVEGRLVSAHVFVTCQRHAMSHLAASSPEGYQTGAAYAVNDLALTALTGCDVINFGGGAGVDDDPADGLVRFKKGFSNRVAPSYLCGAVLDADAYRALSAGCEDNGYFPAYRAPRQMERSDEHQG